jgi:cold shock CspA family protein
MEVPMESLEIARLNLKPQEEQIVDRVVQEWIRRLQRQRHPMITVRVAVERPQATMREGNPYRVRVRVTAPGHTEIVVVRGPMDNEIHTPLVAVINDAFRAVDRQLRETVDRVREQRRRPNGAPAQEYDGGLGFVLRIDRKGGFGFLRSLEGEEVYFHKNAVLPDFEDVQVGTQVHFESEMGEEGLQATTVRVVDKPPHHKSTGAVEDPQGWMRQDTEA